MEECLRAPQADVPCVTEEGAGLLRALGELDGKFMNVLDTEQVKRNAQHPQRCLQVCSFLTGPESVPVWGALRSLRRDSSFPERRAGRVGLGAL